MPGGTANTAGGEKPEQFGSMWDVAASIRPSEYQHFHTLPCVRDALLTGIVGGCVGFGVALMRKRKCFLELQNSKLILCAGRVITAVKYMFVSFPIPAWASYEYCQRQRRTEKAGVQRAVEVMDQKRVEKAKRTEEAKQKRRREIEEKERLEAEEAQRRKRWWKFW